MPRQPRDEFSEITRHHLARSVNYHCSKCDAPTAGPFSGGGKSITTGVAAHICAAAPGGPRYDPNMTPQQRVHYDNGIWLSSDCSRPTHPIRPWKKPPHKPPTPMPNAYDFA